MLRFLSLLALPLLTLANPVPDTTSPFHDVTPIPGKTTIINHCDYSVYVTPTYDTSAKSPSPSNQLISAGTSWSQDILVINVGGVSLKVSKTEDIGTITQFEYTAEDVDQVWYNLSFLNCVKGAEGRDPSACPGWESGVQVVCGSGGRFQCAAKEYCNQSGYFIPEFGYQDGAPVKVCKKSEGLTLELCAVG